MKEHLIPVHIGLMGHIDHGKTQLARALSQKVSTAGLDKHPQSQQRGITIDLGFTMFVLGDYLVTLVDSPGHADLVRSVVAGAGIIDAALLVVAADEGPKVQTGEHLLVLQSMGVDTLIVVISKTDIADEKQQKLVEDRMRAFVAETTFRTVEFVRVSALTGSGIERLREVMLQVIRPKVRTRDGPFLMPVDHAFPIKGHGTIVTGTILRGMTEVGDTLELAPQGAQGRVRSIQTFGETRNRAGAGDRVGINIPDIPDGTISRGDYLCQPTSLKNGAGVLVRFQANPLYRGRLRKKMVVSATVGMPTVAAEFVPFDVDEGTRIAVEETSAQETNVALLLQREIAVEVGMRVLLMRTDLPPTQMRIIGSGQVVEVPGTITLSRRKIRLGRISRVRQADVLVEGFASKKESAQLLAGSQVRTRTGRRGTLGQPFGTRGLISAVFDGSVEHAEEVVYERLVEEEYCFGH